MKTLQPKSVLLVLLLLAWQLLPASLLAPCGLGVRLALAQHEGHGGALPAPAVEQAAEEAPTIEIPQDKQEMIGVRTTAAAIRSLHKTIRTVGRVEYDERRLVTINTKVEGWIERLHIDFVGRVVQRGEPLAEVYSPELVATQQEYLNALKWAGQSQEGTGADINRMLASDARALLDASRQRLKLLDITDSQIRKIEASGTPLRTLTVYSPVSGYVVQKMAVQGMKVMPGEKLFDVVDLSFVWVMADIYENEISLMQEGQPAVITFSSLSGKQYSAKIDYINPALAGETRTAKVRFTLPNPGKELKPQMFANVEVSVVLGDRLAIPDSAVLDTGKRQLVYVDHGDGNFEPREVRLGLRAEGFSEVTRGLAPGDKVAVSATFLIDSEAQLKGVTPLVEPEP